MNPALAARNVLLAATAALFIVGCGSTSTSSSSGSASSPSASPFRAGLIAKADACTLVTADDASAAVGTAVTNMSPGAGGGICAYGTSDAQTTVVVFAQVYPDSTTAGNVSPQQLAAALNGAYGIGTAKVVTGIGDKAVEYSLTTSGTSGIVIFVFKSNVVLMIAVTPTTDSGKVEQLAKTAVGKL